MTRQELRQRRPAFTSAPAPRLPKPAPVLPRLVRLAITITAAIAVVLAVAHHFGA